MTNQDQHETAIGMAHKNEWSFSDIESRMVYNADGSLGEWTAQDQDEVEMSVLSARQNAADSMPRRLMGTDDGQRWIYASVYDNAQIYADMFKVSEEEFLAMHRKLGCHA